MIYIDLRREKNRIDRTPPYRELCSFRLAEGGGKLVPEIDSHNRIVNWIIEAEPIVIQTVKRLFPCSSGLSNGTAKFPNSRRLIEDLNWFMLWNPLRIDNKELLEKTYNETVTYTLKKRKPLEAKIINYA